MFTTDDIRRTSTSSNEVIPKRIRPRDPSDSPNAYKNISVVKKLSKGKFPIYLTSSKVNQQNYAMKVFSHIGDKFDALYKNEIRFASLKHPNVIDMVHYENERETFQKGELKKVSYILMEYAPYGDLFHFILNYKNQIDEKLARTYFRQLIDGMEYLHAHAVAHLDLKPENLLLGSDFNLKIADFDLSHIYGDARIMSRGTRYYRAPEFYKFSITSSSMFSSSTQMKLEVPFAADIYSAGIVLFVLMSGGMYPHAENKILNGVSFVDLMYQDNDAFWRKHCELQDKQASYYTSDFKELFNNMVKVNPRERLTIKQIKESNWYNGPIYTPVELGEKMKNVIN